jgi:hypothetical protein
LPNYKILMKRLSCFRKQERYNDQSGEHRERIKEKEKTKEKGKDRLK